MSVKQVRAQYTLRSTQMSNQYLGSEHRLRGAGGLRQRVHHLAAPP
jgi:hypothetical protein